MALGGRKGWVDHGSADLSMRGISEKATGLDSAAFFQGPQLSKTPRPANASLPLSCHTILQPQTKGRISNMASCLDEKFLYFAHHECLH